MTEIKSEKQLVQEYIKTFALEECLDEIINDVVERRPPNPYVAIANAMEAKTLPEIIDVVMTSNIISNGQGGVTAKVITNIGSFTGTCGFSSNFESDDILQDFSAICDKVKEVLKNLDPRNLNGVDEALSSIAEVNATPSISLALSIACCRAAARHHAIPLYRYLANNAGGSNSMSIPMPVPTVISRLVGSYENDSIATQEVLIYPTTLSTLDNCLENTLKLTNFIKKKIEINKVAMSTSDVGSPRVVMPTITELVTYVKESIAEAGVNGSMKMGVDMQSYKYADRSEDGVFQGPYFFDGPAAESVDSSTLMQILSDLWKEYEIISIGDPADSSDTQGIRTLLSSINETVTTIKEESSDKNSYAVKGVGGDATCNVQVVVDVSNNCLTVDDVVRLDNDKVFNAIKIRLGKIGYVSKAIELCKAANNCGWTVIVAIDNDLAETSDTFLTDFAVAVGAKQLCAGGYLSGEYSCKYNRLLEIKAESEEIVFVGKKFRR